MRLGMEFANSGSYDSRDHNSWNHKEECTRTVKGETGLHDKSSDKEVLQRLHDRLINEFAIDWYYDYMHKLRAIISRMES